MIANTYVVKPFGISEVKVIALKGEPGGPTQEQVNTAVEEYMDDHPEAQIPDGAVTTEKLASNAVAPYADNLVSSSYVSDSEPYLIRKTFAGVREDDELVGGSVVWNQLCNSASVTIPNGRKYFMKKGTDYSIGASTGTAITGLTSGSDMVIDLTLMFGPTIADYIYSKEQASAGDGVALAKAWAGITADYYPYDAGTIKSVTGLTAHKMTGFNQWDEEWEKGDINTVTGQNGSDIRRIRSKNYCPTIPNAIYSGYMAESAIKYINIFWYDADKSLIKYDGIRLNGNQTVTAPDGASYFRILMQQAYGTTYLDDICINLSDPSKNGTYEPYTAHTYPLDSSLTLRGLPTIVDGKLKYDGDVYKSDGTVTRLYGYRAYQSGDESLANAITDGTHTVYKLTTATTETADPFVNPQVCYPDGTEEYIDAREVPIPVGHNTKYMRDLKKLLEGIPDAPTANGTYVLKATVSSSGVTYAWIAG